MQPETGYGRFGSRIARRLLTTISVVGLVGVLSASAIGIWLDHRKQAREHDEELRQIAEVFVPTLAESIWSLDLDQARLVAESLTRFHLVSGVSLDLGADGYFEFGTPVSAEGQQIRGLPIEYADPGSDTPRMLGTLTLAYDRDHILQHLIESALRNTIASVVVVLLVAGIAAAIFHSLVTRRLLSVAHFMRSAKESDLERKWSAEEISHFDGRRDEIDDLVGSVVRLQHVAYRAFAAVRRNEKLFRQFTAVSADWVWETDENSIYKRIDGNMKEKIGLDPADFVGTSRVEDVVASVDGDARESHLTQLEAHAPFRDVLLRFDTPLGRRWVRSSGLPVFSFDGAFQGYRGTGTDVTEETEIRLSVEMLRSQLDNAINAISEGIAIFDQHDELVLWNRKFERANSWVSRDARKPLTFTEVAELSARQALPPGTGEMERRRWIVERQALRQQPGVSMDVALPDGTHIRLIDYRTEDGGTVTVQTDITGMINRQHELEEERERANAASVAKSEFLTSMSHELRTPLNAVIGYSDMIFRGLGPDNWQRAKGQAKYIRQSSEHLLELIEDLLDLSKIEAGKFEINRSEFPIMEEIERVETGIRPQLEDRGQVLQIERRNVDSRTLAFLDRRGIRQILMNIISNAVKFSPESSRIHCRVSAEEGTLRIELDDNGPGIPEEQVERVFQRFEKLTSSDLQLAHGTGIGLPLSRELTEMHGGSLTVENRPEGGLRAKVVIPGCMRHRSKPSRADADAAAEAMPQLEVGYRPSLLLAEDNFINRELMKDMFAALDVDYQIVEDGSEAVAACETGDYDIVLMDIQMPVMDGLEAARRIRRNGRCRDVPILALSANASPEHKAASIDAGMNEHLNKPLNVQKLAELLARWAPGRTDQAARQAPTG